MMPRSTMASAQLYLFMLCGMLGIFGEVCYTALENLVKTRSLRLNGESYLWMFPIYGLIAVLFEPIYGIIYSWHWVLRGFTYMLVIYGIEYLSGSLLTRLVGEHIWRYTSRFNLHGQIQLWPHALVWFMVGLFVEKYFMSVKAVSACLAAHF